MFGLGVPELILIFVVALVIFGPKKLPEIGKAFGKSLGEFRKATNEINKEVVEPLKAAEPLKVAETLKTDS